jgi:preprotein translocase subunit SecG
MDTNTISPFICFGVSLFLVIIFLLLAYSRYLRHKEIMTLAEKGLAYPERRNGKVALRWGIIIAGIGLALVFGLLPFIIEGRFELLLLGLLPTFFGLSLVLVYVLTRSEEPKVETDISPTKKEGDESTSG